MGDCFDQDDWCSHNHFDLRPKHTNDSLPLLFINFRDLQVSACTNYMSTGASLARIDLNFPAHWGPSSRLHGGNQIYRSSQANPLLGHRSVNLTSTLVKRPKLSCICTRISSCSAPSRPFISRFRARKVQLLPDQWPIYYIYRVLMCSSDRYIQVWWFVHLLACKLLSASQSVEMKMYWLGISWKRGGERKRAGEYTY